MFSPEPPNLRNIIFEFKTGLEHVAALAALTHLNLRECRLITNDGLRRLEPLTQLKTFSMSNCTSVSDRGLQSLAKLTGACFIQGLVSGFHGLPNCTSVSDRGLQSRGLQSYSRLLYAQPV